MNIEVTYGEPDFAWMMRIIRAVHRAIKDDDLSAGDPAAHMVTAGNEDYPYALCYGCEGIEDTVYVKFVRTPEEAERLHGRAH